jgi:hypothetical protein
MHLPGAAQESGGTPGREFFADTTMTLQTAHRVDENQAQVVSALRQVGASVLDLSAVGGGCPDLLIGFRGRMNLLMEVKSGGGRLSNRQRMWHHTWRGYPVVTVQSVDEAMVAVGIVPP